MIVPTEIPAFNTFFSFSENIRPFNTTPAKPMVMSSLIEPTMVFPFPSVKSTSTISLLDLWMLYFNPTLKYLLKT